jgi:hypothetical protein
MCQKRTFGILRRARGRVLKESDASSQQPAVLPTDGIGGMYRLSFGSSPHRGKHQQTSHLISADQIPIRLLTKF